MYVATFGFGEVDARANLGPNRVVAKATASCSPGRSAITASRFCWRAVSSISKPISAPTLGPSHRSSRRCLDAAAEGLHWMRDPTRGGVATALNELAAATELGDHALRRGNSAARRSARRVRDSWARSASHCQRRSDSRGRRSAMLRMPRSPHCGPCPAAKLAVCIGEVRSRPARAVLAVTSYGGSRIIDMLVGDPLPRIC